MSRDLMDLWKVKAQWIRDREVSDHCLVWLVSSNKNWGLKPFKFINGWLDHEDGKRFIEEKWGECKVEGWMAHIVKEMLKYLKDKLKVWNREVYRILDISIEGLIRDLNVMEDEEVSDKN